MILFSYNYLLLQIKQNEICEILHKTNQINVCELFRYKSQVINTILTKRDLYI